MPTDPRGDARKILVGMLSGKTSVAWTLERDAYNYAITMARDCGIPRYWANPNFRKIYATKVRSLKFNLKNPENPALRQRLLSGTVTPRELVHMSHMQMFPMMWEPIMQKVMHRKMMTELTALPVDVTGMFQCRKCKSWRTVYYQLQTRSADEPMTTFVTCGDCASRWKF
jgi:transcription elongation factor S-II